MDAEPDEIIFSPGDSAVDVLIDDRTVNAERNDAIETNKVEGSPQNIPYIYRQDVVRCNNTGMIGIVMEVAGDSDSDSSITDDDDDDEEDSENEEGENDGSHDENGNKNNIDESYNGPLPADQVRVFWMDKCSERDQNLTEVTVIDRGFMHGDFVASASDPTGQLGVVVDISTSVDLLAPGESIIRDVSSRDLIRVTKFSAGDYVVFGPWLGRVDDVLVNVTVLFDDGSVCKVMKADPDLLIPNIKNILEDGHFPYYPGQRVRASSSSVFKNSRWLSGLWKASRLEGTVTKVSVGSVFIYWIASAGYGPDSSTTPAEEQSPKNLKLVSCFAHSNWQLGDYCLLPSTTASSSTSITLNKGSLSGHDADQNASDYAKLSPDVDLDVMALEDLERKSEPMNIDSATMLNDSNGNAEFSCSPTTLSSSSVTVPKDPVHETRPLHRKKIRKVVLKRDKKGRKMEDNFESAFFIVNSKTRVDVAWQDGTIEHGLVSTSLIPIDSPGDHDFVAEQYVVEKAPDEDTDACEVRRVGVVKSVNAKERTACVRWLKPVSRAEDPREFEKEEVVSVYELEGHPDYDYCYGDVVVRLSPVSLPSQAALASGEEPKQQTSQQTGPDDYKKKEKNHSAREKSDDVSGDEACADFSDLSWVGTITGLKNGDIEVTWADGMVSTVGPQAIYVVGRDDDDSIAAGSEVSDAASWETVNDDEMDVLQNSKEELGMQNSSDVNSEADEKSEAGDNYSGRNGALSISLAAIGFVTRLATGIFSRGRKDPSSLDSRYEKENQSQEFIESSTRSLSIDELSPKKSGDIGVSTSPLSLVKGEEHVAADATDFSSETKSICNLGLEERDARACHEDDACNFKRFDTAKDPVDHHFKGANGQNNNGRRWLKKIQQDWSILQNNLPDGIYVRVFEDRMDLLRAVIIGAYGTPYQDGLFFFDFHLPPEYPDIPPSAYYHSGGWRINPNLYEEGKVCLSLLNTWTGRGNEVWDPVSSSILQVLVSLQGLVLNSKPYFNEAGYDKQVGTAEGEKNSLSYNENTFLLNCKTMMYLMRKPPKDFEELVKDHFRRRGSFILKACDAYMKGFLIGSLRKDASVSDDNNADSTSVGFKLMLKKLVPKLFCALKEVGADCDEFTHLPQS